MGESPSLRSAGRSVFAIPEQRPKNPFRSEVHHPKRWICRRLTDSVLPVGNYLKGLDYSIVQQCMHCGLCLPTCPTYDATKRESASPRGRIALMRAIADDRLEVTRAFGEEMYFCLGCLACMTACPAGVDYAHLFEMARAEVERRRVLSSPKRNFVRWALIRWLFAKRARLRFFGRLLWLYQKLGLQTFVRRSGILRFAPKPLRELEPLTPTILDRFTPMGYRTPAAARDAPRTRRVGVLAGCVQDLVFADVNCDTAFVLEQNGCEVTIPKGQECCGSLHGHNGEWELAKQFARKNLDAFDVDALDAIVINAAGCGSHLRHYDRLLAGDPVYGERAKTWSRKVRDIQEYLVEIGFRPPRGRKREAKIRLAYHEACHLVHGQKITGPPRIILQALPAYEFLELPESSWCCGSAGVYNITQPEMSAELLRRKVAHIASTGASVLATSNPGCLIQVAAGLRAHGIEVRVAHPVTLLAEAYRAEKNDSPNPPVI
ncbi:MAG: (Fe-S)-binding protein [Verrucomicrobiae bacterium]|nr:(Fe-S)-binding protein [Verrucomicrobiae bacterium]